MVSGLQLDIEHFDRMFPDKDLDIYFECMRDSTHNRNLEHIRGDNLRTDFRNIPEGTSRHQRHFVPYIQRLRRMAMAHMASTARIGPFALCYTE